TGVTGWSQVSVGFGNTCAISSSKNAYCWGSETEPQSKVPSDLGEVKQISAGSSHTCALTVSDIVRCWGSNNFGQLMVPLTVTPRPSILGNSIVGGSVSAQNGSWDVGVAFSYQWFRDGVTIENANSASYSPKEIDFDAQLTVQVTGSKSGYSSVSVISPPVEVGAGVLEGIGSPTVVGDRTLGGAISANPGQWESRVSFGFQWLRDGVAIKSALSDTYTLSSVDLGKTISVRVMGSKRGYASVSRESGPVSISRVSTLGSPCSATSSQTLITIDSAQWRNSSSQPEITGSVRYGRTAVGNPGIWTNSAKLCTFWLSGDQVVPKVTASSYKLSSSEIGKDLRLMVISVSKTGQLSARYSEPVVVTKAIFAKAKAPTFKGLAKVGTKLTGSVTSWESSTAYSYQWLIDGVPVANATAKTFTPTASDLGSSLSLRVCGTKQFYAEACLSSSSQTVGLGSITPAGKAAITSSSLKVGATLQGTTSQWMSGVSLKYQWLVNGSPISGATGNQRVIQQSDKGKTLTFQVTATAEGYQKVVSTSKGTRIP
ncbi:MAG: hypothetical protein ACKOFA_00625, partial [Rhodoluna sp.]